MRDGGNNLSFGEGLHQRAERLMQRLPVGIELRLVSDQPEVVREAIGGFTKALVEAIALGLLVDDAMITRCCRPRERSRGSSR
jgi:multidrug efflux pump subunit AcrB